MGEVCRQRRVDTYGRELVVPVNRLLEFAADLVLLDLQITDFLLAEQLQELAVRNALHDTPFNEQHLHHAEHDKRDQEVRQVPLMIFFHELRLIDCHCSGTCR
ncbi:hypothetical protein D3C87_1799750 [compost metagenome]